MPLNMLARLKQAKLLESHPLPSSDSDFDDSESQESTLQDAVEDAEEHGPSFVSFGWITLSGL